ncbi:MAG TPA: NapC/NirT family cytochrome c [Terriglobales bacterium]|jgi:nitrate/TMAO reductase-like tetraheme cytochrome c subunit|nr:NapC/NirT family cytochrome c [Terriglobales bacterium]
MAATSKRPSWFVLTQHWLSLLGLALVATALISWLFVLPQQIRGHADNPYVGILVFLVLPALFFAGLALVPIGVYLSKRRIQQGLPEEGFDRQRALRRIAWFFGVTTLLNVLIGTQFSYRAVKYMETPQFCGASCHTMNPELAAYENSPHSRVECVECHVAPGAAGWIHSKTNGVRQLFETVLNTSPRPIPSALESNRLVPARETCENCHWPQKVSGVRLRLFSKYADDEANTRSQTVLLMLVGGNRISGIHGAHFGPGVHIRFASADGKRQTIPWVEYRNTNTGDSRTYASSEMSPDAVKALPQFEMECVDCHNRPTHTFDLPERAMDKALAVGDIAAGLPYIKKKSVELLKANYATSAEAVAKLPPALAAFYQQNYPDLYAARSQDIHQAGETVLAIYKRNVFPDLKVTWGTYPNNLGHTDFPGCFRCHDGSHTTADGKTITQDCSTCHQPLAMDEASPEILNTLGIADWISKGQKQ